MHRLAVRIATIALCASALGGCGAFGGSDADSNDARANTADNNNPTMAPDVEVSLRQAQTMRLAGDVAGATRIMGQLMLVYPDDPRVVGEYGKLLVQEKASHDAVAFLRRAIELQPNDWTIYSALGVAFDQTNDRGNAQQAYERALALKPGEAAVLNNYAMSRMLAGDPAGARTLLMQAQASGSADPRIASNLALLDKMSPLPAATPATAFAAAAPPTPVTRAAMPPVIVSNAAHDAPKPLMQGGAQVVMQDVPVDPLAGPVTRRHAPKPARAARAPHPAPRLAAATPKPPKKAKPAADRIPALRMTADAGKP